MIFLSHYLNKDTPCYAGNKEDISIEKVSCMCSGDSANSLRVSFKNHIGTHIDMPRHFDKTGKTLSDYPADFWTFNSPQLIDLPCENSHLISIEDIEGKVNKDTDFLILRTGFESKRSSDEYWNDNPGVNLKVGLWLREEFPKLKAIGFDFISLSSFNNRMLGRQAHKEFLSSEFSGEPILIIEDMKLAHIKTLSKVTVAPLLIENADGGPVTVFAEE